MNARHSQHKGPIRTRDANCGRVCAGYPVSDAAAKRTGGGNGFDSDYLFSGTREDVVRQIGNAVPVNTARALCEAVLA